MNEQRREIAILRALGMRRATLFAAILLESASISALGMMAAFLVYGAIVSVVAQFMQAQTGVVIDPFKFSRIMLWAPAGLNAMGALAGIVPAIKALDGQKVMVRGFRAPVKNVQGHATEFLLARDQPTCCYSAMTTNTEFVSVKVPSPGVESIMDQPITVQGKLRVGALLESGCVLGLYRMDGEKLVDPPRP
jgi:hypothetical protein